MIHDKNQDVLKWLSLGHEKNKLLKVFIIIEATLAFMVYFATLVYFYK